MLSRVEWSSDQILHNKLSSASRVETLTYHQAVKIHGDEHINRLTEKDLKSGKQQHFELRRHQRLLITAMVNLEMQIR